jgi:hypothetical protein
MVLFGGLRYRGLLVRPVRFFRSCVVTPTDAVVSPPFSFFASFPSLLVALPRHY